MTRFLFFRILSAIPTLLLVTVLVFALQQIMPGDPATVLSGEERNPQVIELLRAKYHFNDPWYEQYGAWFSHVVQGDFGMSIRTKLPIGEMLLHKIPVTLELSLMAIVFALAIGLPAGILAAIYRGTIIDHLAAVVSLAGLSIPVFWLGIMLIILFAIDLGWLPSGGYVSPFVDVAGNVRSLLLPAFVLSCATSAVIMRHTRTAMIQVLEEDYVRTARAKGLAEWRVVLRHALRNALIPVVTMTSLQFAEMMSGAVLTEQVFGIPGFGKMIVDGVFSRDYAVVQAVVIVTAIGFVIMNILADLSYRLLNPRLRR